MRDVVRSTLCVCLLVVMATSAQAVVVKHVTDHSSGWRGGTNISATYCWLKNWPNANSDGTIAEFDKAAIQSAIDSTVGSYGGWDAKVVVSQVNWITDPIPGDLDFAGISGLSNELRQKLATQRPATLAQAARIDGITPAALLLLRAIVKKARLAKSA